MFSPGSLEKNCVRPESCSPSRNVSTRFPVGIPLLGDENQQISRIQLAVQKYNNSGPIPVNNKSGFLSPVRHCFLKNSHKSKNYETEEGTTKTEKNSGNYYEGVGSFPTIHLRKSAVRYRPIRRSHDVKVPYPELPVNRYLSHLPELCTDLKPSTRSVLDVLQDLSAKKIHQDEDDGSSKMKSKGLAGDYIMDPNAVYKPLFVQKSKPNSIATRDIMTQTSSPFRSDTPSPQICNLNSRNDVYDPKAELRKKLAKQNNEISASLSSSISASFAIKRKIVTVKDDDQSPDVSSVKKSRIDYTSQTENGFAKSANSKTEPKPNRKSKLLEATSPSPNKDRLTTIFLDMRNTSPKSQIFPNSSTPKSNGVSNGVESNTLKVNGVSEPPKTPEIPQKSDSQENDKSKPMFNFPVSKADSPKPSATTFQFGLPNNTNFNFKPTVSPEKDSTDASQTSTKDVTDDKKDKQSNTLTFVSSGNNFSGFKFGTDVSKSTVEQKTECSVIPATTAPAVMPQFTFGVKSSDPIVSVSQISAQDKLSTPGKSLFNFGQNESSSGEAPKTVTSPATVTAPSFSQQPGMFTFGQKPIAESSPIQTSAQTNVTTTMPSTTQAPSSESSSLTGTTSPGLFSFGQKAETPTSSAPGQSAANQKPQFTFTFGQKTESPKAPETGQKNLFTFGQKAPETSSSGSGSSGFGQASAQPSVSFGATLNGSKPFGGFVTPVTSSSSSATPTQPVFGVSTTQAPLTGTTVQSTSMFGISTAATPSFGALTTTTTTTTTITTITTSTTTTAAAVTTATPTFGVSTITTPVFGVSTTTTPAFGAVTTTTSTLASSTTALTFGSPLTTITATTSLATVTKTTSAFGLSTPTFKFGAGTTQTTTFGAPTATTTQSTSGFALNAKQTTFTSNAAPVFGATTQSVPAFGISSATPAFGATTSSVPTFGTSASASAPMFGSSTSPLTKTTFGTATTQNAFGASTTQTTPAFGTTSQSIPAFGTSTTQAFGTTVPQSTSFGNSSTATTTPAFGASGFGASFQPKSILGAPATTQSVFGSTTNTFGMSGGFGATSQSNTGFGTSNTTQTTSAFETQPFGKTTAPGLFGQNPAPTFSSGTNFTQAQNNIFGAKSNENKPFGAQNNFQFGSTSTSTAFTTSLPSTSAPVFSFGGGASTNTFSFSATSSASSSNTQTPFAFTPNEPFKFGASTSKENPGFGAAASPNFNFGGGQINNGPANAAFDFRQTQNSTAPGFNFSAGSSSSPSVFSFGGSGGSSSSSGRGFNFGTPTPGASFGQSTPTFGVPGTFSIGSGSSQSRPRAASRLRRRP